MKKISEAGDFYLSAGGGIAIIAVWFQVVIGMFIAAMRATNPAVVSGVGMYSSLFAIVVTSLVIFLSKKGVH